MSILIPTYDRADVLGETLEALHRVDRSGMNVEIIVIDNNSADHTVDVVTSHQGTLPLTYLRETRIGKGSALNKALRDCRLKDIVVFIDDDVTPDRDWLKEIVSATSRWPRVSVFGGRIRVRWPDATEPSWVASEWVKAFGFSWHDLGNVEVFYESPACPFGPNFWVRRSVFKTVPLFDETLGPRPRRKIMGVETAFLLDLERHGYKKLYCPRVQVDHRIKPHACSIGALRKRGYAFGRGQVRLFGLHRLHIYERSRLLWGLVLCMDCMYTALKLVRGMLAGSERRRCETTVGALIRFGAISESVNRAFRGTKQ